MNKKIISPTPFGPVAVIWTTIDAQPRIVRIQLCCPAQSAERRASQLYPHPRAASCPAVDDLAARIIALLHGQDVSFSLDLLDLGLCTPFQRRVLIAQHGIPRGRLSTYGLIARHLGQPNAARAVGNALAHNPFPLIVPCHRAIRSDRTLGGFQAGQKTKRALLEMEGIAFTSAGKVQSTDFYYQT